MLLGCTPAALATPLQTTVAVLTPVALAPMQTNCCAAHQVQERLKGYVCPWIGYNDGTILERDGDRKAHPVVIFCPLQPLSHMLSRDGYRRVALLPSVDASSFPGSNLDDKRDNM